MRENFGRGLTDEDVNVIDPFTGAGTFITRMMSPELGLIHDKDIGRKYHSELFANEILLLAYYIAAVNCESMYGQRSGRFEQFNGISLTDTFNTGSIDEHVGDMMASPNAGSKGSAMQTLQLWLVTRHIPEGKSLPTKTIKMCVMLSWKQKLKIHIQKRHAKLDTMEHTQTKQLVLQSITVGIRPHYNKWCNRIHYTIKLHNRKC